MSQLADPLPGSSEHLQSAVVNTVVNGAGLSSLHVNKAGSGLNTAPEMAGGQFDNSENGAEVIYSGFNSNLSV